MEEEKISSSFSSVVGEVKRVMVAIDDSEESFYALEWTLKNLRDSIANSQVVVFSAQPLSAFEYSNHEMKNEHHKKTDSSLLEKAKDICRKFKVTPKTVAEVGDPKDVLREAVDNYSIGLLVVGGHGRRASKSGNICASNYCVHNVKCPFLVVKKDQT